MEDLNIRGMMANRKLARSIGSASWGLFKTKTQHQLAKKGGFVIEIGRFAPSTKTCSSCGLINNNLTLADRVWDCECGVHHDRDVNAAVNIKTFGIAEINRLGTSRIYACEDNDVVLSMNQEKASPSGDPTCSSDKW